MVLLQEESSSTGKFPAYTSVESPVNAIVRTILPLLFTWLVEVMSRQPLRDKNPTTQAARMGDILFVCIY
jgi:hypothetical protein